MSAHRITLLGIPIDSLTRKEAVVRIKEFMTLPGQRHVATPNNEMLVEAQRNPAFKTVLQSTVLNLPDSTGLLWAARMTGQLLPERVTGIDTVEALLKELGPEHPVFLLGAAPGVAEKAAEALKKHNHRLMIAGTFSGSPYLSHSAEIVKRIRDSGAVLLLVAFGAPAQDLWIEEHLQEVPNVRVAIGVGGTFDFLAQVQHRAPQWMRNIGCEWLWRFFQEPSRWKRMWRAVVIFPLFVFRYGKN